MRKYREFNVGDQVMVVDEPYKYCPFAWIEDMDRMCGKLATIKSKRYVDTYHTYAYTIENTSLFWCGNCFVPLEEEELPEIGDDAFLSVIHMGVDMV